MVVLAGITAIRGIHHRLKQMPRTKRNMETVAAVRRALALELAAALAEQAVMALAVLRALAAQPYLHTARGPQLRHLA